MKEASWNHRYKSFLLIIILLMFTSLVAYARHEVTTETAVPDWSASWAMAGANPQRTSWTGEEVRGSLDAEWYKPFEPYISQKVQIIASDGLLFVATARGLYALNAATGAEEWVYPTELPLGHSPTIYNGVAYVGGLDGKIHAVDIIDGSGEWTFMANAGFDTSPLVVNDVVYAGSRDGYFYAVDASNGTLEWKYKTGGPIDYSAAYKDGVLFFASNDSYAYALNADNGSLVWKSNKLPGAGFTSWWPVIYDDFVVFTGSNNYRHFGESGEERLMDRERDELYGSNPTRGEPIGSVGTGNGNWIAGTPTISANRILQYFGDKPWRRTVFVLNRTTGQESVNNYAPVLWASNTGSITRFPPVVGIDNVLYQQNNYMADAFIPGGQISGWQPGHNYISIVSSDWGAVDEPHAASAGGDLVYWNLCCDRQAGAFDVTIANSDVLDRWNSGGSITGGPDNNREWVYFGYDLDSRLPDYNERFFSAHELYYKPYASFRGPAGGKNGIYGFHSDVNPPIPYNGRVYIHRSNAIIAFSDYNGAPQKLSTAQTVPVTDSLADIDRSALQAELEAQVQAILDAGHLRPGYTSQGLFDLRGYHGCGDMMSDYWHNSAETIYVLLAALPYLPGQMQQQVRSYVQAEYNNYPPHEYNHVGWDGALREAFTTPPEVASLLDGSGPKPKNYTFESDVWGRNPFLFYSLWKYAEEFGGAAVIYNDSKNALESVPNNDVLLDNPLFHNAFIAGYIGYLELEKLAGQPESANVRSELNRMLNLRAQNFTKDSAYADTTSYCRVLNVASNFMYLVPELAEHLRNNNRDEVETALAEYEKLAPYWFVSFAPEGFAEGNKATLYDGHAMFMARSMILEERPDELRPYLDVPGFAVGDLYYIHKLTILLQNGFTMNVTPAAQAVEPGETAVFTIHVDYFGGFSEQVNLTATDPGANVNVSIQSPAYLTDSGQLLLTVTNSHLAPLQPGVAYTIRVTASGGDIEEVVDVPFLVGGSKTFLPILHKN